jgi:hypothetical protein
MNKKEISFDTNQECCDYNTAKTPYVKNRLKANYTFLQVSKFKPISNAFSFFMAISKKSLNVPFKRSFQLKTKLLFASKRLLRHLDEVIDNIEVKCDLNETLLSDYGAGYNCANSDNISDTPIGMKLITSSINEIQGIPEDADPDKLNYNKDYSNLANLEQIANIPNAEINKISGENCSIDGQYIIYATLNKNENLSSKYSDVTFRISIPESISTCEVSIKELNVVMVCQNEDKFYNSTIITERQTIQDSEGNELFFIEPYESSDEFACDISLLSSNDIPTEDNSLTGRRFYFKKNNGLSKGAIAAIVIVLAAVVATLIGIIIFLKRKSSLIKEHQNDNSNSTIMNLKVKN